MKTFKQLSQQIDEMRPAFDYLSKKDHPDEVKGYRSRSQGEQDFRDRHVKSVKNHPVAGDDQFTGGSTHDNTPHQGGGRHASGEVERPRQGKPGDDNFKINPNYGAGNKGRSPSRLADKAGGETKIIKPVKEDFFLDINADQLLEGEMIHAYIPDSNIKLRSGESVQVKGKTSKVLNNFMKTLSPKSKQKFFTDMLKSKKDFEDAVTFAAKGV